MRGIAPARIVALVTLALATCACASILGDDFTITEASSTTTTGGSGGSGAQGGGGTGGSGGGGGGAAPAWSCDWSPGSIRMVHSLAGNPMGETTWGGGQFEAVAADYQIRAFLARGTATGPIVDVFSIRDNGEGQTTIPGGEVLSARRAANDRVGAMTYVQQGGLTMVFLTSLLDSDQDGANAQVQQLMEMQGPQLVDGGFVPIGPNLSQATFAITQIAGGIEQARAAHWQGSAITPVMFDQDSGGMFSDADYRVIDMFRDGSNRNHLFLGEIFEGAQSTRHFVLPDAVSGVIAPDAEINDLLIDIHHINGGDYIAAYGIIKPDMTFELRLGAVQEADLVTHTPQDLPVSGNLGTLTEIPVEGDQFVTDQSIVLLGQRVTTPDRLSVIIGRVGALLTNADLPFPDATIFPTGWEFARIQIVVLDSLFDTVGGGVSIVWTIDVPDQPSGSHQELWYGTILCAPAT